MKNKEVILFPSRPDAPIIRAEPYILPKNFVERLENYLIFRSEPDEADGTVQFAIKTNQSADDFMQVDSYKEGYFSARWDSTITLEEFLKHAELFFKDQEHLMKGSEDQRVGIFTSFKKPQIFEFERPLLFSDFEQIGAFLGNATNPLGMVRLESPAGALLYESDEQIVSVLVDFDNKKPNSVIDAVSRFAQRTQPNLKEAVVSRVLNLLPYHL